MKQIIIIWIMLIPINVLLGYLTQKYILDKWTLQSNYQTTNLGEYHERNPTTNQKIWGGDSSPSWTKK